MAATKLYLRTTTANAGTHGTAELSTQLAAAQSTPPTPVVRDLSTTAGAADSTLAATLASNTLNNQKTYYGKWLSTGLTGGDVTAQTWTVALNGVESSANANQQFGVSIYVLTSSDTVRGFVNDNSGGAIAGNIGTELATSAGGKVANITGSAVTGVLSTDVLAVEVWTLGQESGTAGAYTITMHYNGATDPVDGTASTNAAAYVSTPQDLFTAAAAHSLVYPQRSTQRRHLLAR